MLSMLEASCLIPNIRGEKRGEEEVGDKEGTIMKWRKRRKK